jgi:hypothetical protein
MFTYRRLELRDAYPFTLKVYVVSFTLLVKEIVTSREVFLAAWHSLSSEFFREFQGIQFRIFHNLDSNPIQQPVLDIHRQQDESRTN